MQVRCGTVRVGNGDGRPVIVILWMTVGHKSASIVHADQRQRGLHPAYAWQSQVCVIDECPSLRTGDLV